MIKLSTKIPQKSQSHNFTRQTRKQISENNQNPSYTTYINYKKYVRRPKARMAARPERQPRPDGQPTAPGSETLR